MLAEQWLLDHPDEPIHEAAREFGLNPEPFRQWFLLRRKRPICPCCRQTITQGFVKTGLVTPTRVRRRRRSVAESAGYPDGF